MQTFLPSSNIAECARVLDNKRLGKQRVETLQILKSLTIPEYGWKNHPAVKMWIGHEKFLYWYGQAMCFEWAYNRKFEDTVGDTLLKLMYTTAWKNAEDIPPVWWGDERVHSSHRQTLLFKNPEWYSQFGWTEEPKYEYVWPTKLLVTL